MFKILLSCSILFFAMNVFGADERRFMCVSDTASDSFDIHSLQLFISTEDPEAIVNISFEEGRSVHRSMSYEGTSSRYNLIPSSKDDGDLSIVLQRKRNNKWIATVTSDNVDTFSQLTCVED